MHLSGFALRVSCAATDFLLGHPYAPAYFLFGVAAVLFALSCWWGRDLRH